MFFDITEMLDSVSSLDAPIIMLVCLLAGYMFVCLCVCVCLSVLPVCPFVCLFVCLFLMSAETSTCQLQEPIKVPDSCLFELLVLAVCLFVFFLPFQFVCLFRFVVCSFVCLSVCLFCCVLFCCRFGWSVGLFLCLFLPGFVFLCFS